MVANAKNWMAVPHLVIVGYQIRFFVKVKKYGFAIEVRRRKPVGVFRMSVAPEISLAICAAQFRFSRRLSKRGQILHFALKVPGWERSKSVNVPIPYLKPAKSYEHLSKSRVLTEKGAMIKIQFFGMNLNRKSI
jgi:hypothetical protein